METAVSVGVLCESIASLCGDYRVGEIQPFDAAHVAKWIGQFDAALRQPLLQEVRHVLSQTYFSKAKVQEFLTSLIHQSELVGANPCDAWPKLHLLDLQTAGNSQQEMLTMFDELLVAECHTGVAGCKSIDGPFIYVDDGIFTGNRLKNDLVKWVETTAPSPATVWVVAIAMHKGGCLYAQGKIRAAAAVAKKEIKLTWARILEIEDRKTYIGISNVLRPSRLPPTDAVTRYAEQLKQQGFPVLLRAVAQSQVDSVFSSAAGRDVIEQELLQAGAHIREIAPLLPANCRPLGYSILRTLGFGSTVVTFRNCPNNAPLAFWATHPWYPLFPRKTN